MFWKEIDDGGWLRGSSRRELWRVGGIEGLRLGM